MSGGHFYYKDLGLRDQIFQYSKDPFEDREFSELVGDVFDVIHAYDWYISGDTRRETYVAEKQRFKDKWLDHSSENVKRIVDAAVGELWSELYEVFGLGGGNAND